MLDFNWQNTYLKLLWQIYTVKSFPAGTQTPPHNIAAATATHSSAGWQPDSTAYTGIPVYWDLMLQAGVTPALALT